VWEEYRKESDQTITIIGVLILSAKLCVADGHFSIREEEEILKIVPHEPRQKSLLLKILERASKDPHPIEYHALQLKRLIGIRHPDFLEFVVAVLYRIALVDLIVSKEEETDIRKVVKVFGIKKTFADKVLGFFDRKLTKINIFVKNIVDKLNAKSK
jgi:uncharacterized tellurite resistance protein B-like protein